MKTARTIVVLGAIAMAGSACSAHSSAHTSQPPSKAATAPTSPTASASPSASTSTSQSAKPRNYPVLSPGKTVDWTWDDQGQIEKYRITLTKAENLGADSADGKYNVEALTLVVRNTGTTEDEADLLTPMVWGGEDGKVDQTIGGQAAMNSKTEAQTGTDLSLNSHLAPGQYESGYLDVDVPRGPGAIVIPGTDSDGNAVQADSLVINYDRIPDADITG